MSVVACAVAVWIVSHRHRIDVPDCRDEVSLNDAVRRFQADCTVDQFAILVDCPRRAILIEIEFEMRHLQFLNGLPRGATTLANARSRQRSNARGQRHPRSLPVQARQSPPPYGLLPASTYFSLL